MVGVSEWRDCVEKRVKKSKTREVGMKERVCERKMSDRNSFLHERRKTF